jgi:gamma-glutamyltranspeptidase/glutathione hydrolase
MLLIADSFSSPARPVIHGRFGAVSAAHPIAVAAALSVLNDGGTAADAAIAAQAVLCVLSPDACGLGGDMLALVHAPGAPIAAINGTGAAPRALAQVADDGANSVTTPGIVDAWCTLARLHGRLPLARTLTPAIRLAREGMRVSPALSATLSRYRERLMRGGAGAWALFDAPPGALIRQPALADLLERVGAEGGRAFYQGDTAGAIARAVRSLGGALSETDLAEHATVLAAPIETPWDGVTLATQPPMAQGVLLSMAAQALERLAAAGTPLEDHLAVEITNAAFAHRDAVARGAELLAEELRIDAGHASNRGGPRAYLHTAGVATADADGCVVSSLVSVFDDFGSCVFVPELGLTLNNRAGGFTQGANAAAPGKRPVHTLAPIMLTSPQGVLALATPGADGQVQTLLQVLLSLKAGTDLASAIARPRWRSEDGGLLVEARHAGLSRLRALGHRVMPCADGELRFGAVVSAGCLDGEPVAAADWRRETACGAV